METKNIVTGVIFAATVLIARKIAINVLRARREKQEDEIHEATMKSHRAFQKDWEKHRARLEAFDITDAQLNG